MEKQTLIQKVELQKLILKTCVSDSAYFRTLRTIEQYEQQLSKIK